MMRVNVVLLVALVVSALYLVRVQYEARTLYTALDRAQAESHQLETDNNRLEVEKRDEAKSLRVEALAKSKLAMQTTSPATTVYVTAVRPLPAAPATVTTTAQAASGEAQP